MLINGTGSRRGYIRIISFITAAFIACLAFAAASHYRAEKYRRSIEISYARSLTELNDYMTNIITGISKSPYAGTPGQSEKIASSLWRDCSCAKSCLEALPYTEETTQSMNKFLSQVSDYSMFLAEKGRSNQEITDEMYRQLGELKKYGINVKEMINGMSLDIQQGTSWKAAEKNSGMITDSSLPYVTDGYYEYKDELTTYPTLIYDGPYSDKIYQKEAELLKSEKYIDREAARKVAAEFTKIKYEDMKDAGEKNDNLECYIFSGSNYTVGITKRGGYVLGMLNSAAIGTERINTKKAVKKAEDFVKSKGYTGLKSIGYETYENICTVNFANTQNGAVIYPELIKVGVSLDKGEITFFDSSSYITNHKQRKMPKELKKADEAQNVLSKNLAVKSSTLAVIPGYGTSEKLCHQFVCSAEDGTEVIVYVNALTLDEEDILIVLKSQECSLTV